MNLIEDYEVVEVLEPELLTDFPNEHFDSYTVYDLSVNASLAPDHPDYYCCKSLFFLIFFKYSRIVLFVQFILIFDTFPFVFKRHSLALE
jgi:hypothetical protein